MHRGRGSNTGRAAIDFPLWHGDLLRRHELMINSFWNDEEGQTLVEYGLLISLITLVIIGALTIMGGRVRNMWGNNASRYPDPPQ